METQKTSANTQATGYFNAKANGIDIFRSDRVDVRREGKWLVIEGSVNANSPNASYFILTIDPATKPGTQPFVVRGDLNEVVYIPDGNMTKHAMSGTFNADLNNTTKNYKLVFDLIFSAYGEINGELDVTELNI
jgi:hypothetical protein